MLNRNITTVILVFIFYISCAVDIKQIPEPRETKDSLYPIINKPVYIEAMMEVTNLRFWVDVQKT
ncbi:hypothetical protein [Leptospira kanakyensis]|uniref:hypothetical protein n=1 Tax=Leptospira kanakyensis TaxID=2484968 RepID=UPI00223CBD08|nr:hypothetical protein [Leptospira kanakyensis]MCW7470968.1 hypothetical protein [Leptospira kanakyensis]